MLTIETMRALRKRHAFTVHAILANPTIYADTYQALQTMFTDIGENVESMVERYGELPLWRLFRDYYEGPQDEKTLPLTYEREV